LLSLLDLLLGSRQRRLLGGDGALQALNALLHLPDLDDGLGKLLLEQQFGALVLVNTPPENKITISG